jgi:hypothetical protein
VPVAPVSGSMSAGCADCPIMPIAVLRRTPHYN